MISAYLSKPIGSQHWIKLQRNMRRLQQTDGAYLHRLWRDSAMDALSTARWFRARKNGHSPAQIVRALAQYIPERKHGND